jgi:hypothetical protein
MPTSNGQIGRYDIRRGAVVETALRDGAVATGKLKALAVTVDKNSEPSFGFSKRTDDVIDVSLTTARSQIHSFTVDIPTWVGLVHILLIARIGVGNTSGSAFNVLLQTRIGGDSEDEDPGGATVPNNSTGQVVHFSAESRTAPGSTLELSVDAWLNAGTNSENQLRTWVQVLGER